MKYNFDWQRRTTSMPTGVLSYFMGCITVEVLSFFVFWWTECICLSICKSQDNPFLYHTILVQSFARDGSSEIFCSLIFYRVRHYRQVRQGVMSPCHTYETWHITWWDLSAAGSRLADRWGSSWTSHVTISDVPIQYRDSCAWYRAIPRNTWCTAQLAQRVVMQRCPSRFGLGYLVLVSCSVPQYFDTETRILWWCMSLFFSSWMLILFCFWGCHCFVTWHFSYWISLLSWLSHPHQLARSSCRGCAHARHGSWRCRTWAVAYTRFLLSWCLPY